MLCIRNILMVPLLFILLSGFGIDALEHPQSNVGCYLTDFLTGYQVVEDRVYIKADSIFVSQKGIFFNFAGQWLQIRNLSSDEKGIFVSLEAIKTGLWGETWICPNPDCGYENYVAMQYCSLCHTKQPRK